MNEINFNQFFFKYDLLIVNLICVELQLQLIDFTTSIECFSIETPTDTQLTSKYNLIILHPSHTPLHPYGKKSRCRNLKNRLARYFLIAGYQYKIYCQYQGQNRESYFTPCRFLYALHKSLTYLHIYVCVKVQNDTNLTKHLFLRMDKSRKWTAQDKHFLNHNPWIHHSSIFSIVRENCLNLKCTQIYDI